MSDSEQRIFTRVDFELEALVEQNGQVYDGHVLNLSLRGMLFQNQQELNQDDPVRISLQLTGHTSTLQIDMEGKILRKDSRGYALEFQTMDMDSFIHLKSIIAYNDGDPDKIESEFRHYIKETLHQSDDKTHPHS